MKSLVVDADGHFLEPDSLWTDYLAAKYRPMAPRSGVDSLGQGRMIIGDQTLPRVPAVPVPTRGRSGSNRRAWTAHDAAMERAELDHALAGADPNARLAIMDKEGIDVSVMYPTIGLHFGAVMDLDLLVALCQAYNNWAHDFCDACPGRLLAPAVVPQRGVTETIQEARRAVEDLGLAGIHLRPNPIGRAVEDPAWEPLWALLEELDAPLAFHEGTTLSVPQLGADRTENFLFQHAMSHPFEHMAAMLALIAGGTLERHPALRVLFLEAGCGWVPYWLERIDAHLSGPFAYEDVKLGLSATSYFKRQCFVSADPEEQAVVSAFVSCLGPDNLCWSTDFPHVDHEWKGQAQEFSGREDLSVEAKRSILGGNAMRAYRIPCVD